MTKIVIDTRGGDNGAFEMVKGAAKALAAHSELSVLLVGEGPEIEKALSELSADRSRVEILHAPSEITNYDNPAEALFKKTDSSMLMALDALSKRDDLFGLISSGNTGVLLTGAMRYLPLPTRVRPALAAVLPAVGGGFTCLVDTGATIDCTADMLHHFARLGRDFMRITFGIENPRIGLLSNGSESSKGNKLVKETYPLLEGDGELNFVGNIEGSVALGGGCDVLVCDGFAGNQVLKVTEGTAARIITDIMKYAHREKSEEIMKLGAHLMSVYDIGSLGGGNILGVRKPVIKTRGNAGAAAIVSTSGMLLNMAKGSAIFDKEKNKV